jgi:uncharacterized SAM-binding protein YcdF (DUF218 family)
VAAYLGRAFLLEQAGECLDVSEPPQASDYAMVLGGGDATRPFVAAALFKAGLAGAVLVPRTRRSAEVEDGLLPPEEVVIERVLAARGVPGGAVVFLDGECASTRDEADALARFLDTRPDCSVAVVTSPYHTRRARGTFRRALGGRAARVRFVAAPGEGFGARDWWRSEEGFKAYAREFVKLAYYQLP